MTVWTAWDNRHLWPQIDPDGYVFLGYAFDAAGEAIFHNWTGHEVEDAAKRRPERLPTVEQAFIEGKPHYGFHKRYGPEIRALCGLVEGEDIPQAAWRAVAEDRLREWRKVVEAEWRRDEVIRQLAELARTGELAFASRRKGGGQKPTHIASEAWELDYPWVPFATLGWDERLGLASPSPTSWLFVNAASFGRCLGRGDPPLSAASYLMDQAADEDASRFLFEEGEWVSASLAIKQVDSPESLIFYAGTDNGERPFLRSRCAVLDRRTKDGGEDRKKRELYGWFWSRLVEVTSDWEVGLFVRQDAETCAQFSASCVEFSLTDIQSLKANRSPEKPAMSQSESLDHCVVERCISPASSGLDLQELERHHKQVMASAKAVSEVREWLTKDWEDPASVSVTKATAWEIAHARWGDRISFRAFTAEWQKLSKVRPWMQKRGPRRRAQN